MTAQTPGQTAYEAYADERAKTDNRPVDWAELGAVRQGAWEAAARAVRVPPADVSENLRQAAQQHLNEREDIHLVVLVASKLHEVLATLATLQEQLKAQGRSEEIVAIADIRKLFEGVLSNMSGEASK